MQYGTNSADQTSTRSVFVTFSPKQKLAAFTDDPYWLGNWHHYAVVFSESAHTFKVYYDYRLYFEVPLEGELAFGATTELYKVGAGGNSCEWPGPLTKYGSSAVRLSRPNSSNRQTHQSCSCTSSVIPRKAFERAVSSRSPSHSRAPPTCRRDVARPDTPK